MKNILFISTVFLIFYSCTSEKKQKPTVLQVGVSKAVINPAIGSYIAGDKQNRTFTGIKDNLYAKAIVAYDGETAFALVTLDCIGLLYQDLQTIRKKAAFVDFGIPFSPENIIISSTHTHSGPDVVGLWGKDYTESGVSPDYMKFLFETVIQQIASASNNLKPATTSYSLTEFGEEWVANICDEEIDRSVTILQFIDDMGKSIATLTNFACHLSERKDKPPVTY
ncbi:neutral/alkaline non-lysosomal ceramidase N-terminal domain-containing protein [Aquiflexum sp.]|uniref:neutral/alkaline non-lysosomal ceramidase N-terminal domain-containing protein n=1 Tax=Aquiflexum sp. TaxID=1872584 RepID=UPI00359486C8